MSGAATPHASASTRASLPPTGAATPALPPQAPTNPGLPPPSTFDVLPDLHKLLRRLLDTSAQPPAPTPTPVQPSADGPLEIQHVPTAATDVKLKIQKARRAVMALPDIDRTCEDQQEEIEELELRITRLKASLRELGRPTDELEEGDQSQTSIDCMDALELALTQGN
ncbi:hypothetical protein P153DRAFT_289447 [Dothidotthia symphoricarpi CBS 119687]|uniref:Mediator of RNA polymerase II transcription subunit 9 n=1 Tax=Dothidotthia symphoricarpi CBS 119687 TaxID=1392245 RepID=A0A6A6AI51_9PLEO|nr:uncharacterized protein P153DRAFT_289447 [Dothidotthia symphoricarpi CBS 119687]KAF2130111.1 hypothetical protein P153DRAFT_289447 [Dothidotthia symphoricarpi CBS 119687]